jgi:hypothetical protein
MRVTRTAPALLLVMALSLGLAACAPAGEKKMAGVITTAEQAALVVVDQPGASGTLTVDRVLSPEPAWIVVHLDDNGKPGTRVGLLHVDAGENTALEVDLDPAAELTDRLLVALHADRGTPDAFDFDMEKFDASPDKPFFIDGKELATAVRVK